MDFLSSRKEDERVTRPVSVVQQGPTAPMSQVQSRKVKTNKLVTVVVALLVVVAVTVGGWLFFNNQSAGAIKKDAYQAVFLTNGQVYFGKLSNTNSDYLSMSSIYYLQVQQAIQPGEKTAAPANASQASDNVQLVKLGNELHGPDDQMQISQKQVLFWENLKTDGKVSQAIAKYKADNK